MCIEDVGPEGVEVAAQRLQPIAPHRVDAAIAARLDADQARPLEHPEVLGDGRPAHMTAARIAISLESRISLLLSHPYTTSGHDYRST